MLSSLEPGSTPNFLKSLSCKAEQLISWERLPGPTALRGKAVMCAGLRVGPERSPAKQSWEIIML